MEKLQRDIERKIGVSIKNLHVSNGRWMATELRTGSVICVSDLLRDGVLA